MSTDTPAAVRRDVPERLHEQISAELRARISSGEWPAHYKLAAEPDLAHSFGVSRGTLRRALRTLIDAGQLIQVHGRGTFVAGEHIEQPIAQEMTSLAEALRASAIAFTTEITAIRKQRPPERIGRLLGLTPTDRVWRLDRLRSVEDTPLAKLVNYVDIGRAPNLDTYDLSTRSFFDVLRSNCGLALAQARRTFEATVATGELARILDVPAGHPVMYLEQLTYLPDGNPVEYSDVWIRGDRLRLTSMLTS